MAKKSSNKTSKKVVGSVKKVGVEALTKRADKSNAPKKNSKKTAGWLEKRCISFRNLQNPHRSFKRSYREDYLRELEIPGVLGHIVETFKVLFANWRLFASLLIIFSILAAVLVGFMGQNIYQGLQTSIGQTAANGARELGLIEKAGILLVTTVSSGGLFGSSGEAAGVFGVLVFLLIWLTTAFSLRQILAGNQLKVRDALYNSGGPLMATVAIFLVMLIQSLPLVLFIVALSSALETNFLSTPFYALLFVGFSAALISLSAYLLSSSFIALVAVTAPGLYPVEALKAASDLMFGRRIKFIIRLIALIFAVVLIWTIVMLPLILIDLGFKNYAWASGIPFIPLVLVVLTCFTAMFCSTYIYLYYKWLLKA